MNKFLLILFCALTAVMLSCKKESTITGKDALIAVSADSLHFDTLFTSTGSTTQSFKLYNKNDRKLLISSITMQGGAGSFFHINADGFQGPEVKDLEMEAGDSLYVFVTVSIDPGAPDLPYIVQDSIRIQFNGLEQWVHLDAWGQNATFLRSRVIGSNTTWTNERPYVILGGVQVDQHATLTIQTGTRIYLHGDAPIVIDGTLRASGENADSLKIVFASDRLDQPYRDYPGAWPGIYFRESSVNNMMKHVIVKNAYQGIVAVGPSVNGNPKLSLDKCIIDNCYDAGLAGVNTNIEATDCLISNCGKNVQLVHGGNYSLTHCTVVSYSNGLIAHKEPVLAVTNYIRQDNQLAVADLNARFTNCIFWGDNGVLDDEVVVLKQGSGAFNAVFTNCLWKVQTAPENVTSSGIVSNEDPQFLNIDTRNGRYDFHLGKNSPAVGAGINAAVPTDLEERQWDPNFPALGAYEATF